MNLDFRKYILSLNDDIELYAENVDTFTEEEFANIRHNSFGASDSSRILNVNPFPQGTKDDLLYEKIHRISNDEIGKKATVRMGKDLEPFIINRLEKAMGYPLLKPTDMFYNKHTGQSVNFDGISWDAKIGKWIPREIKTISFFGGKHYDFTKAVNLDEDPTGVILHKFVIPEESIKVEGLVTLQDILLHNAAVAGIPVYYYTQLQQQLSFTDAPYGTLTVMDVKSWHMYEFTIERSDYVIQELAKESMFLRMKLEKARRDEKEKTE